MPSRRARRHLAAAAIALVATLLTVCDPAPVAAATTQRVVVLGDSIPAWLIRDGGSGIDATKYTLVNGTLEACDGAKDDPPARSQSGAIVPTPAACKKGWPSMYPPHLTTRADVAMVMTSTHAMLDHKLDGTWRHPCHSPARTWYQADMTARLKYVATRSNRVVLVLPAWPAPNSRWIMPADYVKRADCVRSVLKAAGKAAGARVVDFGAYLCPTGPTTCRNWRIDDGIHINRPRAAAVLRWLVARATEVTPTT